MRVPFLDLRSQFESIKTDIQDSFQKVFSASAFSGGIFVQEFENQFAEFCRVPHAIGVGNGTDALWLALLACGVGPGDEVITVPNSFIATAEAISLCGAQPVFVDIHPETYTLDPEKLEAAISSRTRVIIPVHLFGQVADMDAIMAIAQRHGLCVIEDACQAHGAEYKGQAAGSIGHAGCFSFYPGKNLGAYGEAGAVVTADEQLAEKMRVFRDHGQSRKYQHAVIGWNARMDGLQGAFLSVKLKHLNGWNQKRRSHAARYSELLRGVDEVQLPVEAEYAKHVYHIYAIQVDNRDEKLELLNQSGVVCGIHYPVPIHLQNAYQYLRLRKGTFPVGERAAARFLSLPLFPEMTEEQIDFVVESLKNAIAGNAPQTLG